MVNDMRLPQEFEARMQDMLGEAYPAFRQSYEKNKFQALRVNPMKGTQEAFLQSAPFTMRKVPWAENGFYYSEQDQPGKHPWHEAGVYYIQEPSAMAPAAYLEARREGIGSVRGSWWQDHADCSFHAGTGDSGM